MAGQPNNYLMRQVRVLYQDKVNLRRQLGTAQAEAADVESCVSQVDWQHE